MSPDQIRQLCEASFEAGFKWGRRDEWQHIKCGRPRTEPDAGWDRSTAHDDLEKALREGDDDA